MKKDMVPALLSFNYSPADYIDTSWVQSFDRGDMIAALIASDVGKPWASKAILLNAQLSKSPDFDFDNPLKILALQPRNSLAQIIFHAGIILNCQFFRSVIRRQERKALEACLGEKPYRYAIKKAPLMGGALPTIFACPFSVNWGEPDELKKHVFRSGMRLLGAVLSEQPEGYKKRLLFKFPMASQDYFYAAGAEHTSADVSRLGGAVFKKLMKEFGA